MTLSSGQSFTITANTTQKHMPWYDKDKIAWTDHASVINHHLTYSFIQ